MKVESNRYSTPFTAYFGPTMNKAQSILGTEMARHLIEAEKELKDLANGTDIYLEPFCYDNSGFRICFMTSPSKYRDTIWTKENTVLIDDLKGPKEQITEKIVNKVKELKKLWDEKIVLKQM